MVTEFLAAKRTEEVRARDPEGCEHVGYFIHAGRCRRLGGQAWFTLADGSEEGCRSDRLAGTALHGVVTPAWTRVWRKWSGLSDLGPPVLAPSLDQRLDRWAGHLRAHLDWDRVRALIRT